MRLPLLRIAQILALWSGATFTVVSTMGTLLGLLLEQLNSAQLHSWLWQTVWMLPCGIALLWGAHRLGVVIGDAPRYSQWRLSWKRGLRALLRPTADDELHDFTIHIAQSPAQVVARLEQLPQPGLAIVQIFTQRLDQPTARVRGNEITVAAKSSSQSVWQGKIEASESGTVLRGQMRSSKFEIIYLRVFNLLSIMMLLPMLFFALLPPYNGLNSLFVAVFLVVFLCCIISYNRLTIFIERQHERAIEQFWRQTFDAHIAATPRPRHFLGP